MSLEREARQIVEVMTRVADKLADGASASMVFREVTEANKLLFGMKKRLEL